MEPPGGWGWDDDDDDEVPPSGSLLGTVGQLLAALGIVAGILLLIGVVLVLGRWIFT
jgi:hypothetical protein